MNIEQACAFLEGKIRKTPIEYSAPLSEMLKVPVYLKLEFLQLTGSFKLRGALYYLSTIDRHRAVAACSVGNHGLAIAYAAKELGITATIFVPKNTDPVRIEKIAKLGALVKRSSFIGYDETLAWAKEEAEKSGLHLISAYDDERIMAGNGGTLAVEILQQLPEAQNFIVPVGGGGLSAGLSYVVKKRNPAAQIIGCQHRDSCALKLSLERGEAFTSLPPIETYAGGIEGGIGEKCFAILKDRISAVALASEEEIMRGFTWFLKNHQYLIEPTSAVCIASCLFGKIPPLKGPTVIVLSGRNVGFTILRELINADSE